MPESVFESTAYIRQLGESKIGGRSLLEASENILFSGDESAGTKKALKKLGFAGAEETALGADAETAAEAEGFQCEAV